MFYSRPFLEQDSEGRDADLETIPLWVSLEFDSLPFLTLHETF